MLKEKLFKMCVAACGFIIIFAVAKEFNSNFCYAEDDVYDGNYHDIAFDYEYDNDTYECTDVYTTLEKKKNSTSAYIYNNNSAARIPAIRIKASDGTDCTYGSYQSCELGEAKYLLNTVYENGYRSMRLWMDPGNGYHVDIHILWSPDSIPL